MKVSDAQHWRGMRGSLMRGGKNWKVAIRCLDVDIFRLREMLPKGSDEGKV